MLYEKLLALNETWVELQSTIASSSRVVLCMEAGPTRTRLATLSRDPGFTVEELDSAEGVVQLLAKDEVDLLLVAEDPPDMSALALCRYARGRPVTPKIIVLAQRPNPRKVLEAIRLGITDYLLEPEQGVDEIFAKIQRRIEQLNRQKLQVAMLTDLRRLLQEKPSEERTALVAALKERLDEHRQRLGHMNRVLCADADPMLRKHLCGSMAGLGLLPMEATSAQTTIDMLFEDGADLVLLSGQFPDLGLKDTLERIHKLAGPIPVWLLASVDEEDAAMTALRLGFADTIRKPIASPEQAAHRVARTLKDHRRELLAENLVRELYRLMRAASAARGPKAMEQVASVFDDIVVLSAEEMEDKATAPIPKTANAGGSKAAQAILAMEAEEEAADKAAQAASAGRNADQVDRSVPETPQRLLSGEFQIISDGRHPDVLEAESLPDTVVIQYIDDLLFPEAAKQFGAALGAGQRLTPRVERSTFVRYGATGTEQASLGYAHDLSLGGMFILSDSPPPVGTDLRIELQLPNQDRLERIRVQGRVMWHTNPDRRPPQGDGFGVQFTVVDKAASAAILRILHDESPSRRL
ncbi:MAG: PilZ domain-containing protein [Polyangia bacterium]|jgi:DNA-binding response OmpR family regulator|nr:PilZ domain-containing protein [Polyangia bacterium]